MRLGLCQQLQPAHARTAQASETNSGWTQILQLSCMAIVRKILGIVSKDLKCETEPV
jgi:hypothetical protein